MHYSHSALLCPVWVVCSLDALPPLNTGKAIPHHSFVPSVCDILSQVDALCRETLFGWCRLHCWTQRQNSCTTAPPPEPSWFLTIATIGYEEAHHSSLIWLRKFEITAMDILICRWSCTYMLIVIYERLCLCHGCVNNSVYTSSWLRYEFYVLCYTSVYSEDCVRFHKKCVAALVVVYAYLWISRGARVSIYKLIRILHSMPYVYIMLR